MNYTEWLESLVEPLYEVNDKPACPKGYKWDKKTMMCVPKTAKDDVGANHSKDRHPDNGPGYNVIGSHGMNGAPYAYEEPATQSESYRNDYEKWDKEAKEFEKRDKKMKYGNAGRPSSLRPGEVRKPTSHGFESNKDK